MKSVSDTLGSLKKTKIMVTVGPAVNSYEAITKLIDAGANGFRLNFSHGTNEERTKQIAWIRKAAEAVSKPVSIVQDLQGPKIRLGDFDGFINVKKGQTLNFKYLADYADTGHIPTQYDLSKKVKRGERLQLSDGKVKTTVTSVHNGTVSVEAHNEGILIKRKGINLPDTDLAGDIITAKDKADLVYGSAQDIDYVALSFVQQAEDIRGLKKQLKSVNSSARVIAKIETSAAVDNIEEIVQTADMVMIARGDLAVEVPAESVPILQRRITGLGQKYAKPVIVATQLLGTMVDNPEPSRSEVADVSSAVIVGADCLMLSDETATGSYPVESVEAMKRIILYTEQNLPLKVSFVDNDSDSSSQAAISNAIITLADQIEAQAIVAETKSGATALNLAARRSQVPLIAVTSDNRTAQQLALVYSVRSYVRPADKMAANKLTDWLRKHQLLNKGDIVITASGRYPGVVGTTDTIKVRVLE